MKLKEIAAHIGVDCDSTLEINGINTLKDAKKDEISFIDSSKYLVDLQNTKAGAVITSEKNLDKLPSGVIALVTEEPYLKLALATKLFAKPYFEHGGPAMIPGSAEIMPNVHIGKKAVIGENVVIMSGAFIGDYAEIGDDTVIYPNVVVYRDCKVGKSCILHAGCVIGSDGFGFAHTKTGEHVKIYQNGIVVLEDDVEIGANTTIDRAVFGETRVKNGVKIDNLVQIGHNCEIGEYSIMVSQSGLAGSTILGRNVVMGGQSAAAGHVKVGDFATIAARGGVTKSLEGKKVYGGFPLMEHKEWLKLQAKISRLLD
jgi:UDP-3-O-[3-hydroxymyristoyl] glucosamine N-acyltransferase